MRKLILPISYQRMVEDFMITSGQKIAIEKVEFTTAEAALRYDLYMEELEELETAVQANDRVEQIDAVADLLYILLGTSATRGDDMSNRVLYYLHVNEKMRKTRVMLNTRPSAYQDQLNKLNQLGVYEYEKAIEGVMLFAALLDIESHVLQEAFIRVHESNMSKFCTTREEAVQTVKYYQEVKSTETYFRTLNGLEIILRKEDDKVMKSINYTPVDLKDLVEEEGQW